MRVDDKNGASVLRKSGIVVNCSEIGVKGSAKLQDGFEILFIVLANGDLFACNRKYFLLI
jgi:hypothetical protein